MQIKFSFLLFASFFMAFLDGFCDDKVPPDVIEQPLGNFSVPTISQIAPLVSFGQLLIGKKALLPQLGGSYIKGHKSNFNTIVPSVTYGIRDDLSILFAVPFSIRDRSGRSHSSGIEDLLLQLEYGYYSKTRSDYAIQASILGNIQFPTGSSTKNPPTGAGTYSYFFGTTFAYTSINWYAFVSPGIQMHAKHHATRLGNSYLYQWGFARYIKQLSPKGWVFDLMLEFDGMYSEKEKIRGKTDPNSGGNVIFVTPSIWLASNRWLFQWGIGFPFVQNLNGHQDKLIYSINYNLGIAVQF